MCIKLLTVIASVFVFSASLFAEGIESSEAKAIEQECLPPAAEQKGSLTCNQSGLSVAAEFIGDVESKTAAGSNEGFLWGLRGFGLTFVPGLVGLLIGSIGDVREERI